ncbi:nucleotidyl transferase AbiEii/AbiGii toxin family protein [Aliarcobacter butzleri]|uniref:Nucleotidyl transferase AbiEii/AbiGii toxin family protein n=1 Tax=Aliarcobacter butzleri TaxID=28197 RepID=A0AAW7PRU8_9BACT|nr:nucleotidyl transferase AbiEii/AbiGii toxin family protein [Aliarcobacter butzleri]MDN5063902.1 nucleotidyl transferase AbiEii/AbiGii toxin family protein [Aliarcobacter butzleri]MDN5065136.1 nucleotidyl transferase AbiEii/AbiGii toxin family protein [Aliarcobacter butzleri]
MHRDNWNDVFDNQDKILKQLKPLEDKIFLAGGTGLQRFVLPQAYRHSEDLDFFFTSLNTKEEIDGIKNKILELMLQIPDAKLENIKWIKDEKAYRMFYSFKDNDEIIKIELLNFTCCRLKDLTFGNNDIFRTENIYNLLLYKLKALCDRPDTIKDLFDLYFILRDLKEVDIKTLIEDINKKFEDAIGIKYSKDNIISSLNHRLEWDIEIGEHINHLHGLKLEIDLFQKELKNVFLQNDILDFSYHTKIKNKALEFGLDKNDYIDAIEDNQFLVEEWNKYFRN